MRYNFFKNAKTNSKSTRNPYKLCLGYSIVQKYNETLFCSCRRHCNNYSICSCWRCCLHQPRTSPSVLQASFSSAAVTAAMICGNAA